MDYLIELRKRLIQYFILLFAVFAIYAFNANSLYTVISAPLINLLGHPASLIAINITSPFIVPLKLALIASFFTTVPVLIFHAWKFISPALYKNERKLLWIFISISIILFYCGVAFSYFIVTPLTLKFLLSTAPSTVEIKPDIQLYLHFIIKLLFAFGVCFETPVITFALLQTNIIKQEQLSKMRPYIIVMAFVIGMLLTPPDVISQIMLAIPLWLLFELGIILHKITQKNKRIIKI